MTISHKDLVYWYRQFRPLLSGWTISEQIQFHHYAIKCLTVHLIERGHQMMRIPLPGETEE